MPEQIQVAAASHARRARLLLAFAAWNVWVWGTRLWNLVQDPDGFDASIPVHVVLFVVSLGGAAALAVVGWSMRSESRSASPSTADGQADRKGSVA